MMPVTRPVRRKETPAGLLPGYVRHPSFGRAKSAETFDPKQLLASPVSDAPFMTDDITKDHSRRMHYAAHRWREAATSAQRRVWRTRYLALRDRIVLGNRKLVYRAVRCRSGASNFTDDLIGDCQIVLIQAVAVFNPWMGIRFSTYAYTCIVRALARKGRKNDWLSRALPIETVNYSDSPAVERISSGSLRLEEFLHDDHPLLTDREKRILAKRYVFDGAARVPTLERVGREMGLSKERVRQVQSLALAKLRQALITA